MGERELCKLEVVGSIPIGSTILLGATRCAGFAGVPREIENWVRTSGYNFLLRALRFARLASSFRGSIVEELKPE